MLYLSMISTLFWIASYPCQGQYRVSSRNNISPSMKYCTVLIYHTLNHSSSNSNCTRLCIVSIYLVLQSVARVITFSERTLKPIILDAMFELKYEFYFINTCYIKFTDNSAM